MSLSQRQLAGSIVSFFNFDSFLQVANPLWRKQAYSWPVLPDGNWNCKYAWPMQGYIFPNVPSPSKRRFSTEEISIRLKVYRNGESDKMR